MEGHPFPEAVMTLPCGANGPLLVACDALLHYLESPIAPIPDFLELTAADIVMKEGAPRPSALWTRLTLQSVAADKFKSWYADIASMEWKAFIGAHGVPVEDCSHDAVVAAVNERLSN